MSRITASPFRCPSQDKVVAGPWLIGIGQDVIEGPESVAHWDYATRVSVTRSLKVDLKAIRKECGLDSRTPLGATIRWHSTWTNLRGCIGHVSLADSVVLTGTIHGELLGASLRLDTIIYLGDTYKGDDLAPSRAASILWKDSSAVALEGISSRFPIQLVDFEKAGISAGGRAAWMLMWSADSLDAPALGVLRLLVNSKHPMMKRLIAEGPSDPELVAVRSSMRHDIRRQLTHGAIVNVEFDRYEDYGEGTLGTALQGILDLTFGDEPIDTIRGLAARNPSEFEARLQAKSGLFWPEST